MVTNMIFVDTSALIAFLLKTDQDHEYAKIAFAKYNRRAYQLVTTDYVADELVTFLRCKEKLPIRDVISVFQDLSASDVQLFAVKREIFEDALVLMAKFGDHYFSFTDCISFQVMKDLKIKNVLTTDKDFEIAGFNNLLLKG